MRRQSKPFVTEYRASGRRSREPGSPLRDADGPSSPAAGRLAEDDYEAVFRAADALFASPGGVAEAPARPPTAAGPLAADIFADPMAVEPNGAAHDTVSPETPPPEAAPDKMAPTGGGRILRAIEEPGPDPFAAYEAALAPKRRGRKPGSKNKPKAPASPSSPPALRVPVMAVPSVALERARPATLSQVPAARAFPRGDTPLLRTREPFAWVRTKLRPGEKWKRRLPKVAW